MILRLGIFQHIWQIINNSAQQFGIQQREPVMQAAGRIIITNGADPAAYHWTGIEPLFHQHGTYACLAIASGNRPLNWRCPAPARQQRGMTIDAPETGHVQNPLR